MKCIKYTTLVLSLITLSACDNALRFSGLASDSKQEVIIPVVDIPATVPPEPEPEIPTPEEPEEPTPEPPQYAKTSGTCAADSSTPITSCISCKIPAVPPEEPPMSLKAQRLYAIMTSACQIYNKSYPANYVAPTAAIHFAKLNRCSPTSYPDTSTTAFQESVVKSLASGDATLLNKMFGGLWYQPPYSDAFETYFGLEVGQAAQLFCSQTMPNLIGLLYPASFWQDSNQDPLNFKMPPAYAAANEYRTQLKGCITESRNNPWQPSPPPAPKKCQFETLAGVAGEKVYEQVSQWLGQGFTVGIDVSNAGICAAVTSVEQIKSYTGSVTVGGYKCQ